MKSKLREIADVVYNQEHSDEGLRLSAYKVVLGLKWGGRIPEGEIERVANAYQKFIRSSQIAGV